MLELKNKKGALFSIKECSKRIYAFVLRYRHAFLLTYGFIYMAWFNFVEYYTKNHFHIVYMPLDDYIPFVEYFIIPYLLWFPYIGITIVYFLFKSKDDFKRMCFFLFTGMTIFLIVSTVYPNGAYLRPIVFPRNNIFTKMVEFIYNIDTPTNLFPSLHVFNAIGVHLALHYSKAFRKNKKILVSSFILCILIILSTMLVKQHSIFDVITAIIMAFVVWIIVYNPNLTRHFKTAKK